VQPHPDRGPAAAEHGGELIAVQVLPGDQGEQLPVGLVEVRQGGHDGAVGRRPLGHGLRADDRDLVPQPGLEPFASLQPAALVGQHPPGDAVQPQASVVAVRHVVQPAPGDHERLRDDVGGVLRAAGAPQRVAEHL